MPTAQRQLTPLPFTDIRLVDAFWAPRQATNRTVTLQHIYRKLQETGRIAAFDLNFTRPVPSPVVEIFGDSDPAKWIEAASYSLTTHPDAELAKLVDGVADKVIAAQQADGYLNTHFIAVQPEMRWKNLRDWHEMYCAGHLIEGAVAHAEMSGDAKLLNALSRYADHIDATFGAEPGKKRGYCGHPEIELALVKLYHATGNPRYLKLATFFVDERGKQPYYYDQEARDRGEDPGSFWAKSYEYCQAHVPIREQQKVVGHAVRAVYLLSAVADLAHENDDASLRETCERLWDNLIQRRMYLTGGIGPSRHNEGFTEDYDLPDETAYAETCATIGLVMWNHRLLQFDGEAKYADIMERGLYNGVLSGVSLSGDRFLYENPLSSAGNRHRQEWFYCPCCPSNVARLLASLGNYMVSTSEQAVWVHLFAGMQADLSVAGVPLRLAQETRYPWEGSVRIELDLPTPQTFSLNLRLPGWCERYELAVNGKRIDVSRTSGGYLSITREWRAGDVVEYAMDMPIQPVWANPAVRQLQGRVAIQRGPLVYCLEGVDHDGVSLDRISVDPTQIASRFRAEFREGFLGGAVVIRGAGRLIECDGWESALYRSAPPAEREIAITAVPYCLWDNRDPGEMRVWMRTSGR